MIYNVRFSVSFEGFTGEATADVGVQWLKPIVTPEDDKEIRLTAMREVLNQCRHFPHVVKGIRILEIK